MFFMPLDSFLQDEANIVEIKTKLSMNWVFNSPLSSNKKHERSRTASHQYFKIKKINLNLSASLVKWRTV